MAKVSKIINYHSVGIIIIIIIIIINVCKDNAVATALVRDHTIV